MWVQTVPKLIAFSLVGGVFCGFLWDLLVIIKMAFSVGRSQKRGAFFHTAELLGDLLFCIVTCCTALVALYYGNSGKFRFVTLAAMAAGFAAYKISFGALLLWTAKKVYALLDRMALKLLAQIKKLSEKVKIKKKNKEAVKIGKNQGCKFIRGQRRGKRAFYKSESHPVEKRKKSA